MFGGSSGINFMTYTRPCAQDLDDWATELGLEGWSFSELLPYFQRHQYLEKDHMNIAKRDATVSPLDMSLHGTSGPIHTSLPTWHVPFEKSLLRALDQESGLKRPDEPNKGEHLGFFQSFLSIDRTAQPVRSYAANGYLAPVMERPNLRVIPDAIVTRVVIEQNATGGLVAKGVELIQDGVAQKVFTEREVILSAGSFKSPQLLELSGIGHPNVLEKAHIPCVLANRHVGKNLQEKTMSAVVYELGNGQTSIDSVFLDPNFAKEQFRLYQEEHTGALSGAASLMGFIPFTSQINEEELNEVLSMITTATALPAQDAEFQDKQNMAIAARMRSPSSANIQFVGSPANFNIAAGFENCAKLVSGPPGDTPCYALIVSNMYPLSRGSVHVRSSDPLETPDIDPGFHSHSADAHVLAAGICFADRVFKSALLKGKVGKRVDPPPEVNLEDEDEARQFARDRIVSYHHALGSCAMGQVVDERLRVKGVEGLRIIDASVLPMQVSAAIMPTVYAVAEKGADMIKQDHSLETKLYA
jgi:choline dehydrogenase-like flavoprotein